MPLWGSPAAAGLTAAQVAQIAAPDTRNWTPNNLTKARKAIARTLAGLSGTKLNCFGDSTTGGVTGGGDLTAGPFVSWPYRMYQEFLRLGIPARYDFFIGANITSGDTRFTLNSNWGNFGGVVVASSNVNDYSTFAPTATWDSCLVYFDNPSTGTIQWKIDGGAAQSVSGSQASPLKITTTKGTHTLSVSSGAGHRFYGFEFYDSTTPDIRICNQGGNGAQAGGLFSADYTQGYQAANIAGDINIINYGINDYGGGGDGSGYQTAIQNFVTALNAARGTAIIEVPTAAGSGSQATIDTFNARLTSVSDSLGIPLFDTRGRYGATYAAQTTNGWINDALHPYGATYVDKGRRMARLLLAN